MAGPESNERSRPDSQPGAEGLATVRGLATTATQRLLGDTIAISDDDWRAPSRLPGWSRGHVATHVARQADGLCRLAEWARTGKRQEMYASSEQRDAEIEAGSGRSGLDLQIDLDTSAERLAEAFEALDEAGRWDAPVEFRGGLEAPARSIPLARLMEVVLHHVDLDVGFGIGDIDQASADWVLAWSAFRLRPRADFPSLLLVSDSGYRTRIGTEDNPREVTGSGARLLGWLTGRGAPDTVSGADGLVLPPF